MVTHSDFKDLALGATETDETSIGTISIPHGASRIIGIWGYATAETATAADGFGAQLRLDSPDISGLLPSKWPITIIQGPAGTLADSGVIGNVQIIPVNIPVKGKSDVLGYIALDVAQGGTCHGAFGLIFE